MWRGGSAGTVINEYVGLGERGLEHLFTCDEGKGEGHTVPDPSKIVTS